MKTKLLFLPNFLFSIMILSQAGSLDMSFVPETGKYTNINTIAIQSDEKILLGADTYIGQTVPISSVGRLNSNGSIDTSFNTGNGFKNFSTFSIVEQANGKIIVGGWDNNSGVKNYLSRLNPNGSLDSSFNIGTGPNDIVRCVTLQPDGKIIIAGDFTLFNGEGANYLARLNADGSRDNTFNSLWGADNKIISCIVLKSGKIIIKGLFTKYNGVVRNYIARLNTDGSLDTSFIPEITINDFVSSNIVEDNSGEIIFAAGYSIDGIAKRRLIRFKNDGKLDKAFSLNNTTDLPIYKISIQVDQKILIGGDFSKYNEEQQSGFARLNSDGSLDETFIVGSGVNSTISSIISSDNDNIIIAGGFSTYNDFAISRIAKILTEDNLSTFNTEKSNIKIYPNPVRDRLFVSESSANDYEIFNIMGQKIISGKIDKNYIDVVNLQEGTYIVNFKSKKGETITEKFIKH